MNTIQATQTKQIFSFKISKSATTTFLSFLLFCLFPLTILLTSCSTTMPKQSAIDPLREHVCIVFRDLTKPIVVENKVVESKSAANKEITNSKEQA